MCLTKFSKDWGVVEEVELKRVVIVPGPRPGLSELHMTHINRNDWNRAEGTITVMPPAVFTWLKATQNLCCCKSYQSGLIFHQQKNNCEE